MKKIGIIAKHTIAERKEFVFELVEKLRGLEQEVIFDEHTGPFFNRVGLERNKILQRSDIVIVLGGDGTLLKTARAMPRSRQPLIAAVNMGTLGFLTEFTSTSILKKIERMCREKSICIDERFLLRVTLYRNGKKHHTSLALNEAVINQGGFARLINLVLEINKRKLTTFHADGLIISTPTGSTGHSLSAGGPIIHPKLEGVLLTPICPVKLSLRPIIVPNTRNLEISMETQWRAEKKPIVLTIDGQITFNLKRGDRIRIRKSSRSLRLIRMRGHNYYQMLRKKLNWGM